MNGSYLIMLNLTYITVTNAELIEKIDKNSSRLRLLSILVMIVLCLCLVGVVGTVISIVLPINDDDNSSSNPPTVTDQQTTTAPSDEWKLVYKATIHMTPSVYDTWTKKQPEITYPVATVTRLSVASSCADCWYKDPLIDNWQNAKISQVHCYTTLSKNYSTHYLVQMAFLEIQCW